MKIIVNGSVEIVNENSTIYDLIIGKRLNPDKIVVEYNSDIIQSDDYKTVILKKNDELEILNFVGGG
jgi:sulfur carrier protein